MDSLQRSLIEDALKADEADEDFFNDKELNFLDDMEDILDRDPGRRLNENQCKWLDRVSKKINQR